MYFGRRSTRLLRVLFVVVGMKWSRARALMELVAMSCGTMGRGTRAGDFVVSHTFCSPWMYCVVVGRVSDMLTGRLVEVMWWYIVWCLAWFGMEPRRCFQDNMMLWTDSCNVWHASYVDRVQKTRGRPYWLVKTGVMLKLCGEIMPDAADF